MITIDATPGMPLVSIEALLYINEWGEECPIVDLLDDEGDWLDLDDPDEHDQARVAIARHPLPEGGFYSIDLWEFGLDEPGEEVH